VKVGWAVFGGLAIVSLFVVAFIIWDAPWSDQRRCERATGVSAENFCASVAQQDLILAKSHVGSDRGLYLSQAAADWARAGIWAGGHRSTRGHMYAEKARSASVELVQDTSLPSYMRELTSSALRQLYGTDAPKPEATLLHDATR
jgi:hypothetical protein